MARSGWSNFLVTAIAVTTFSSGLPAQTTGARNDPASTEPIIEATGVGANSVPPDHATVTLSVETKGAVAAQVAAANARIQQRVLDTLRTLGFSGDQVSTVSYNVEPNREYGAGVAQERGYLARNTVRVRVSQLDRIGVVIDAALNRGATGVSYVTFESSKVTAAHQAALSAAAENARTNATTLAKALGGSIGHLVSAAIQGGGPRPMYQLNQVIVGPSAGAAETSITPNDISVQATVVTRWQFVPGP